MLGVQPNSTVRGNLVHDSHPYFMYGHGIYLDEGASGITIEQNWVHSTYAASYLQHYGVNNTVRSNVWAWATGKCIDFKLADGTPQHYCPGHFWHCAYRYQQCGFSFKSNILMSGVDDNCSGTNRRKDTAMCRVARICTITRAAPGCPQRFRR